MTGRTQDDRRNTDGPVPAEDCPPEPTGTLDGPTRVEAPQARRSDERLPTDDTAREPMTLPHASRPPADLGAQDEHTRRDLHDRHTPAGVEPAGSLPSLASAAPASSKTSIATTSETMQEQDLERARWFLRIAVVVCLLVGAPTPWLGGNPLAARIFGGSMIVSAAAAALLAYQLRNPAAYTMRRLLSVGFLLTAGAFTGIIYCGIFSPAAAAIPFGLFFFGLSRSARGTMAIYLTCAVAYGAIAGLMAFDVLSDPGLVTAEHLPLWNRLAILGLTETIFFATHLVSRFSYRAAQQSLERHDRAVRELAAREALLKEAHLDLEGALRARGLGRYTDELVGSYRLGAILGRGGMGEVYDAVDVDTEQTAAIKLLHPQVLSDQAAVKRFLRECKLAAMLEVPNVVRVFATSDEAAPIPFIAMERLHGQDLSDHLRARGPLPLDAVIRCLRDAGAGLDAAREAGIVHRDMKPRNLFLAEDGGGHSTWKILDFGVSKLLTEATMTHQNMVGTPSYMAPEQASSAEVSHRTDLYALGVIAYRALTGRPAFTGDGVPQILYQVLHQMPPRPSLLVPLPGDVDRALMIAMAKEAADRFDSGAEMAAAFEAASRRRLPRELRARAELLEEIHPWASR